VTDPRRVVSWPLEQPSWPARRGAATDLYGDPLPPGAIARLGTLRDNIGEISSDVVLSPDGTTVTATSTFFASPLRLWDTTTGRVVVDLTELEPPKRHGVIVRKAAFSPNNNLLAAGDSVGTVRIGRTDTGKKVREFAGPECVHGVSFLPDGQTLSVSYVEGSRASFDITTGNQVAPITKRTAPLPRPRVTWLPIRSILRSGRYPFFATGCAIRNCSPDGKYAWGGSSNNMVSVWDVKADRQIGSFPHYRWPPGLIDETWIDHILFSPDSKLLAVGDTDHSLCLWSIATGHAYRRFPGLEVGHGLAFMPDGKRLISGGRFFRYWDIARGQEIRRFPQQELVSAIVYVAVGKTMLTADGMVLRLWEVMSGRQIREYRGHLAEVYGLAVSKDGGRIASQDDDGTLIVWDLRAGQELWRIARLATSRSTRIRANSYWQPGVAFAATGKMLAACDDQGLRLFEVALGREIGRIAKVRAAIRSLCVSPDGKTLAGVDDRGACLWDVATGRALPKSPHVGAWALAFAPAGHRLATGETECVKLWDTETGRLLRQLDVDKGGKELDERQCRSVAFSTDGKIVGAGCDDGIVRFWDTATGDLVSRLDGHNDHVSEVAFCPDGKSVAVTAGNGTTLIWSLPLAANAPIE
jgi:WD40 repeat protein